MNQTANLLTDKSLLEIMGHARGGQGMVTAFEILAKIFSASSDYEVQAFPSFGVERTGAPIQGFLRISKNEILNRSNIYHPHLIVVFDESLLGQVPVFEGLREDGIILLNTSNRPEMYQEKAGTIYTIAATKISLDKKLGSKSLPIVNSAMIGALLKILGGDIEIAKHIIMEEVPSKHAANAEAAEIAYNNINEYFNPNPFKPSYNNILIARADLIETPFWDKPMSLNKTGSWRLSIPIYITREAPCTFNCPAGTDVREFIKQAAAENFEEAFKTIYSQNPFPSLCSRDCPRYCEQMCNRKDFDEAINISAIEGFIGDKFLNRKIEPKEIIFIERIAIIGSGLSQLTAALRLRLLGYQVSIFEPSSNIGSLVQSKISDKETYNLEINNIIKEGIEVHYGKMINADDVSNEYNAIITIGDGELDHNVNKIGIPVFDSYDLSDSKKFPESIGIGNKTAKRVHAFLRNKKHEPIIKGDDVVTSEEMLFHYYGKTPKNNELHFILSEIIEGNGVKEISEEAKRCLHCGSCFNCGNCFNFCPDALVYFDNKDRLRIDYEFCKGCGICYHECPSSAMKFDIIKKIKQ